MWNRPLEQGHQLEICTFQAPFDYVEGFSSFRHKYAIATEPSDSDPLVSTRRTLAEVADSMGMYQKIEGAKLGVKIAETNTKEELETKKIASRDKIEGAKLGTEIAKELMIDERERDIEERIDKRDTTREKMIDDRERDE